MYNAVRDKLTDFTIFKDGQQKLGTADITLPSIEYMTETLKGPGISGEVEMPTMGQTSSMEMNITWRTLNEDVTKLHAPKAHDLECRGAIAHYDSSTSEIHQIPVSIRVRGIPKKLELGKLETAATMDSSNTLELVYLKETYDGVTKIEIDKFARIFKINGTDYLAEVRAALGLS